MISLSTNLNIPITIEGRIMKIAKIGVIAIVVVIASAGMGISYTSIYGVPISNQRASAGMAWSASVSAISPIVD